MKIFTTADETSRPSSLPPNIRSIKASGKQKQTGSSFSDQKQRKITDSNKSVETNSSVQNKKSNKHTAPGRYVYEYLRINLRYVLPSIQTIQNNWSYKPYLEAEFRFNESEIHLNSIQCQYIFVSEYCSAIIPRIEYDSNLDTFNGFVTPLLEEDLLETTPQANLVNIHVIQPILDSHVNILPAATVLSAYGTDQKITAIDILKRWLMIYNQFNSKGIRVLGFSTDGDPNFTVKIPSGWTAWFFLSSSQLFLFMQDGAHVCTKIRNAENIYLFSSQPCENVFRNARALSGIYLTRINFTISQFFKRINKLNVLTELKQFEATNSETKNYFPVPHKIKQFLTETNSQTSFNIIDLNTNNLESLIFRAYEVAQEMAISVGMSNTLIKNNRFSIEQSSQLAKHLLQANSLTESEILGVDGSTDDDLSNYDEESTDITCNDDIFGNDDLSPTTSLENLQ
ncbi:unnamed protein product [Rotaria magnacalcarata]